MRTKWLNFVLFLTNRIYTKKQEVAGKTGIRIVTAIIGLVFLETVLAVVSLPLYFNTKSSAVSAYFEEKGGYEKVTFDYNLRRVLTLTGVGIILAVWAVKLILILFVPTIYGPLQLYKVTDLQPLTVDQKDLILAETGVQTAKLVKTLSIPTITEVIKERGGNYTFKGTGEPTSTVVLLLSDMQTAIYRDVVDKSGNWQINHLNSNFKLSEGNHRILVFSYKESEGVRSDFSPEQYFRIKTTWVERLVRNVDSLANWSVVGIILIGAFLTLLTI